MGIFVAWMRAKAMAAGVGVAPKGKQSGTVLIEYLILAGAVLGAAAAVTTSIDGYFDAIASEFDALSALVVAL